MLLRGKTAVITGCLKGIGRAALDLFAREGCNVWACAERQDAEFETAVEALARQSDVAITPLYFDLTQPEQIKAAIRRIVSAKQPVDVLLNIAGMTRDALFHMTTIESMKAVFEVNFFSQMLITQYVTKLMARQHSGSVIFVSSVTGIDGNRGQLSYSASKAALLGATKTLAAELAADGIRVNAIAPGVVQTDMIAAIPEKALAALRARIPMRRMGLPEEVARVMLFLASDLSSYVTGQVIRIDGGIG
jgi:3-oxoacyl-[acyl-carrier protein] reductase